MLHFKRKPNESPEVADDQLNIIAELLKEQPREYFELRERTGFDDKIISAALDILKNHGIINMFPTADGRYALKGHEGESGLLREVKFEEGEEG